MNATNTNPDTNTSAGNNYTWSDPPLNTSAGNPYYLNNQSWVINESGHDWVMDLNATNNSGTVGSNYPAIPSPGSVPSFAILINASDVIFDGMGAILDGSLNHTKYGIIVNNQSANSFDTFNTDSTSALHGISITNITLINFDIAGILFNNVIGNLAGDTASNITENTAPASNVVVSNSGNGIVLQNSQDVEVSYANVHDNMNSGITLTGSNYNNLTANTANKNGINGASGSAGGTGYGIYLNNSNYNNLSGNNANYNGGTGGSGTIGYGGGNGGIGYGIYLTSSNYNNLTGNNANHNGGTGGTSVYGPTGGSGGTGYGIYLTGSRRQYPYRE